MESSITQDQGPISPPTSSWIRFLRSYGPTPNNLNLFDEYVSGALRRAKVQPIALPSPYLEAMQQRVISGALGSILIAGTAGDGKTYHCRSLWMSLGGTAKAWSAPDVVKTLDLADGRRAIFVKDLSELNDEQSDAVLDLFERSVFGEGNTEFAVIATNHGQILERLRNLGVRQNREHPLRRLIQEAFLFSGNLPERLALYDLSRTAHRQSLEEVILTVAGHPEWESCRCCALQAEERICPILENRNRLMGAVNGVRFADRLGDLVETSRLNGWHLPVRDLLALVSNIILGHPDAKEDLMSCSEVGRIQLAGAVEKGSLYDNAFGVNLPRRRAMDRSVFKAFSTFGIGEETSNGSDGLLVYGADDAKLSETFQKFVGSDPVYGATTAYLAAQQHYLEGDEAARLEGGQEDFLSHLATQRRRFFFTLPENEPDYHYWDMTAFRYAGDYLKLSEALFERKAVSETIRARLVRGLNRVMTGLLLENSDRIFVASSGGFTQSRISVLCDTQTTARRQGGLGMAIKLDPQTDRPALDITLGHVPDSGVQLTLTPVRFEFLCRVAEGALPGSFSNECLEDLLAFKAKLLRKAERLRSLLTADDDEEGSAEEGVLTLNFIEIEKDGHGFTRPSTIRIA
ncbi:hypothetical protein [Chromobacterium haemolyticum]|uniref:hypothetical protein n=1 Tax=Chromobacterium haemolyticum TaxID=394935 RepID=UPI00307F4896